MAEERGATTPGLGLPYPVPSDPADVPADIKKLAEAVEAALGLSTPAGLIAPFGGGLSAIPAGWIACDGRAVDRAAYARLFAVIGTAHGTGDGTTTFNVPDLAGRVPVGKAASGTFYTLGAKGGEESHAISVAELPVHNHPVTVTSVSAGTPAGSVTVQNAAAIATGTESADHSHSGATGGQSAQHTHHMTSRDEGAGADFKYDSFQAGTAGSQKIIRSINSVPPGVTGSWGGSDTGTNLQDHTHGFTTGGRNVAHTHTLPIHGHTASFNGNALAAHTHTVTLADTGGGSAMNVLQPYTVVTYMIKA